MAVVGLDPHGASHLYRTSGADLEKGHELLRLSEAISSCLQPEARHAAGPGPRKV